MCVLFSGGVVCVDIGGVVCVCVFLGGPWCVCVLLERRGVCLDIGVRVVCVCVDIGECGVCVVLGRSSVCVCVCCFWGGCRVFVDLGGAWCVLHTQRELKKHNDWPPRTTHTHHASQEQHTHTHDAPPKNNTHTTHAH